MPLKYPPPSEGKNAIDSANKESRVFQERHFKTLAAMRVAFGNVPLGQPEIKPSLAKEIQKHNPKFAKVLLGSFVDANGISVDLHNKMRQ